MHHKNMNNMTTVIRPSHITEEEHESKKKMSDVNFAPFAGGSFGGQSVDQQPAAPLGHTGNSAKFFQPASGDSFGGN